MHDDKLYWNAGDNTDGYRWPARSADSNGSSAYIGTIPDVKMGALIIIPKSVSAASLGITTEPAKKILRTMQEYGAYIVDTFPGLNTYGFLIEIESSTSLTVDNEVIASADIDLGNTFQDNHPWTTAENTFFNTDVPLLADAMKVVKDSSIYYPRGYPVARRHRPRTMTTKTMMYTKHQTLALAARGNAARD